MILNILNWFRLKRDLIKENTSLRLKYKNYMVSIREKEFAYEKEIDGYRARINSLTKKNKSELVFNGKKVKPRKKKSTRE